MKKIIFTLAFSTLVIFGFAQKTTINSVADGPWLSPTTWDCNCVPTPGANFNISHHVILNTNWAYSSGSVTINTGGSLKKNNFIRTWAQNGGALVNDGTFEVDRLAINAGTVTNSDSFIVNQAYYIGTTATLSNIGLIDQVDSLQNNGTINNDADGYIEATNLWNNNTLNNSGTLHLTNLLNSLSFTNDNELFTDNFLNTGTCNNNKDAGASVDFMNTGKFTNSANGIFFIDHDFLNGDSLLHDALFINEGQVKIWNDFTNLDTIRGTTGFFCIGSYSANAGYIKGTVDICDLTPLAGPPYIDINTGIIEAGVTSCTHLCTAGIAENETIISNVKIYPNPFSDQVTFEFNLNSPTANVSKLTITDMLGQQVFSCVFKGSNITVENNNFKSGVYFYTIENGSALLNGKLISE